MLITSRNVLKFDRLPFHSTKTELRKEAFLHKLFCGRAMKFIQIVVALSGILIPALATAGLNYNSVDVGYSTTSYSNSASNLTQLNFSYTNSISAKAYYRASFGMGNQPTDSQPGSIKVRSISLGGGYHVPLKDNVDAVALGNLVLGSSRFAGNTTSANGYDFGAGIRALFRSGLEGTLMVLRARNSNGIRATTDTFLSANFGYSFIPEIQMYAGIDLKADMATRLGLRFFF